MPRDYYEILGLGRDADAAEVKKSYRRLAKQYHPDVNKGADAPAKFAEVQEAYEVLSDPEKRRLYDQFGHAGVHKGAAAGAGPEGFGSGRTYSGPDGFSYRVDGFEGQDFNINDVFEQFFSGRGGGGSGGQRFGGFGARDKSGRRRVVQPAAGQDIEHAITVPFDTAAHGGNVSLRVGPQTLDVKIPKAIADGGKLRLRGKGLPSSEGGEPGDLILTVHVSPHAYFQREHLDLLLDVPLSLDEAVFGTELRIPTLDGHAALKVPPGTGSGKKLRLRGAGLANHHGEKGDLYAVIRIEVPKELPADQRDALEKLRGKLPNPRQELKW